MIRILINSDWSIMTSHFYSFVKSFYSFYATWIYESSNIQNLNFKWLTDVKSTVFLTTDVKNDH